jgi:hypothetical protein
VVARRIRSMLAGLVTGIAACGPLQVAATETASATPVTPDAASISRIRPWSATLAAAIRDATERSVTFRGLVEAINASAGIVYVEEGDCGHGVRACLVAVTRTASDRIVWVRIDPRKKGYDLMASIGHELTHAVEVLSEPRVTSTAAMTLFYLRVGRSGPSQSFETKAAIEAGDKVRSEVTRSGAGTHLAQ